MYSTYHNIQVDRATYPFKGIWKRADSDINEDIYYYYVENKSYKLKMTNRVENVSYTAVIGVFGYHKFAVRDRIELDDGTPLRITDMPQEVKEEINPRIIHLVKPRVVEQVLTLG